MWLLDGFVRRIPIEIDEAAVIDGLSVVGAFRRAVLPLLWPGVVAALLVVFFLSYNDFLFAVYLAVTKESQTLTVGLSLFQGDRNVQFGQQAAAGCSASRRCTSWRWRPSATGRRADDRCDQVSAVELVGLTKSYGDTAVVDDLTLTLPDGSLTVLVGPSGCGKSTTLRIVAGLETADGGTVHIGDRDVTAATPRQRDVAMVFQNYALYPQLSVAGNIAFPLRNAGRGQRRGRSTGRRGRRAGRHHRPARPQAAQLSGGQQQRVAIARALVRTPSVFLFDEPLSNLDAKLRSSCVPRFGACNRNWASPRCTSPTIRRRR